MSVRGSTLRQIQSLAARFLLVTLIAVGALCGVVAVVFHRCRGSLA